MLFASAMVVSGLVCVECSLPVSPAKSMDVCSQSSHLLPARACSDNWSQVRFASSTATRTFMQVCARWRVPVAVPNTFLHIPLREAPARGSMMNAGIYGKYLIFHVSKAQVHLSLPPAVRRPLPGTRLPAAAAPHVPQQVRACCLRVMHLLGARLHVWISLP
jgi:hypothetical protein